MHDFHIHVDALQLSEHFAQSLTQELAFSRADFAGHRAGSEHFEPNPPLTQTPISSVEFRSLFDKVVARARDKSVFHGYIEGECITIDEEIAMHSPSIYPWNADLSRARATTLSN